MVLTSSCLVIWRSLVFRDLDPDPGRKGRHFIMNRRQWRAWLLTVSPHTSTPLSRKLKWKFRPWTESRVPLTCTVWFMAADYITSMLPGPLSSFCAPTQSLSSQNTVFITSLWSTFYWLSVIVSVNIIIQFLKSCLTTVQWSSDCQQICFHIYNRLMLCKMNAITWIDSCATL